MTQTITDRERTRSRQQHREQRHRDCPMEFRQKGPHMGMYCACHGTWIQWLRHQDLLRLGIAQDSESVKNHP